MMEMINKLKLYIPSSLSKNESKVTNSRDENSKVV